MIDKNVIYKKIVALENDVQELKKLAATPLENFEASVSLQWTVLHGLQLSIQIILDTGNHLLAELDENNMDTYTEVIQRLGEKNIIPESFAEKIKPIAGLRNLIVHEYAIINFEQIYKMLQDNLPDFTKFIEHIKKYMG